MSSVCDVNPIDISASCGQKVRKIADNPQTPRKLDYQEFLHRKSQLDVFSGFEPLWIPDFLFDFQKALVEWAVRKGKAAIFADCGLGKGQSPDDRVLTPDGWRTIGSLHVGDQAIGSDGLAANVVGVYPKAKQDTYRLHFSDGTSFVVDLDHLHICRTNNDRQRGRSWRVINTAELLSCGNLRYGKDGKSRNYDIPIVGDVLFAPVHLPIDPYLLGILLGDGHLKGNVSFSTADEEIISAVRERLPEGLNIIHKDGYDWKIISGSTGTRMHPFRRALSDMGLLGKLSAEKHIPDQYLFASPNERLELLRGLMDTDGYIDDKCGCCQFYSVSENLATGVTHLLRSLGGVPTRSIKETRCNGKRCQPCHVITFSLLRHNPFRLSRKARRWNPAPRDNGRWIDRIEFEKRQPTVCIAVDSHDSSYVTEDFIVTHNTPMQLVWAENIRRKTAGRVLIMTPLAVSHQTIREGEKFGIEVVRSTDGKPAGRITVTNYERLHLFDPADYVGAICDESSILKNFDGVRKAAITDFMRKMPYRLLCTATAAPNDYVELGTSSEALGYLGHMDMLTRFFRNAQNTIAPVRRWTALKTGWANLCAGGGRGVWRFKRHAEIAFWQWVCSWARALRRPSDLGFDDDGFILPELIENEIRITNTKALPGWLFVREAVGLQEERQELRLTLRERCERVAELVDHKDPAVVWCNLNDEGKLLARLIPDAVEISGSDSDEKKEEAFIAFKAGKIRVLVTKPKIGAFGLNWEHCAHTTFFASHSYEQYYQAVRRCWRFGQRRPVRADMIITGGSLGVLENMKRKSAAADKMFSSLVGYMNEALGINRGETYTETERIPEWL